MNIQLKVRESRAWLRSNPLFIAAAAAQRHRAGRCVFRFGSGLDRRAKEVTTGQGAKNIGELQVGERTCGVANLSSEGEEEWRLGGRQQDRERWREEVASDEI